MALDYNDVYKSLSCMYSIVSFKYRSLNSVIYLMKIFTMILSVLRATQLEDVIATAMVVG